MTEIDAPVPESPRLLLSVEAAAELLAVSRTRMFLLIKCGAIKSVRVGRLRRIPAESLTDYVDHLVSTHSHSQHESQI